MEKLFALFKGLKILCTDFSHILEKKGKLFKGGGYQLKKYSILTSLL